MGEIAGGVFLTELAWENLAAAPSNPVAGQSYWDTTLGALGTYDGTQWVYVAIAGSNTKAAVDYVTAAALPASTYANGTAGVGATLTKNSAGALSIDGRSPAVGQRILVKDQATAAQNGIYTVTDAGGATSFVLTRATDADTSARVAKAFLVTGKSVVSVEGTANDAKLFVSTPKSALVVGTDAQAFTQINVTQQARVNQLTDNSGGVSGGATIAVVTDNTSAANAIATLAAKVNALETALHNSRVTL